MEGHGAGLGDGPDHQEDEGEGAQATGFKGMNGQFGSWTLDVDKGMTSAW